MTIICMQLLNLQIPILIGTLFFLLRSDSGSRENIDLLSPSQVIQDIYEE